MALETAVTTTSGAAKWGQTWQYENSWFPIQNPDFCYISCLTLCQYHQWIFSITYDRYLDFHVHVRSDFDLNIEGLIITTLKLIYHWKWFQLCSYSSKSKLVQLMPWFCQGTCWPTSMSSYGITQPQWVNSLAPGRFDYHLKLNDFKLISMMNILSIFSEIAIGSMPLYLTDH